MGVRGKVSLGGSAEINKEKKERMIIIGAWDGDEKPGDKKSRHFKHPRMNTNKRWNMVAGAMHWNCKNGCR
jgi:hypothetical protein